MEFDDLGKIAVVAVLCFIVAGIVGFVFAIVAGYSYRRGRWNERRNLLNMWGTDNAVVKLDDDLENAEAILLASRADFAQMFWEGDLEETVGGFWIKARDFDNGIDDGTVRKIEVSQLAGHLSRQGEGKIQ